MSKILAGIVTVALCFTLGYSLQCYNCALGSLCIPPTITCSAGQQCYNGQGKAAGVIPVTMSGCLDTAKCNTTENATLPAISSTIIYQITKTCCNTDLCNTAAPLANTHTLTLAIASLASLLLTKALV